MGLAVGGETARSLREQSARISVEKQDIIIRSVNLVKIAIEAEILRQGTHRNSYWRRAI
jgi:hypothetical protein